MTLTQTVNPSSVTFNNSTALAYTVSGTGFAIADNGAGHTILTIEGAGTVTLNTANTYSGGTFLLSGQLNLGNAAAIGTGPLTISTPTGSPIIDNTSGSPMTLANNNAQNWNGNFTFQGTQPLILGTGAVALGTTVQVTINNSSTLTVGGVISGTGNGLTLNGNGTLLLTNNETYTGPTIVNGGTLQVNGTNNGANAGIGRSQNITINSGGTITIGNADNSLGGNTNATLTITINAGGLLTNASGYAGTNHLDVMVMQGGTLGFTGSPSGSSVTYGTYNLDQGWTVGGGSATATSIISAPDVVPNQTGGTVFNVTTAATQTVFAPNGLGIDLDVTGYFSTTTGTAGTGLILQGGGVMRLDGVNTYTQATTISSGTLIVGNGPTSTASIASTSFVVNGTLAFNTTTSQAISAITGGGTIAQWGPGILTVNGTNTGFNGNLVVTGGTLSVSAGSLPNVNSATVTGAGSNLILQTGSINSNAGVTIGDGAALGIITSASNSVTLSTLALGTSTGLPSISRSSARRPSPMCR